MATSGETAPMDNELLQFDTSGMRALDVLTTMLTAKEKFESEVDTYEADLQLFGGQSKDEAAENIAYVQENARYHELRRTLSYPTDSVFSPETMNMQRRSLAVGRTLFSFGNQVAKALISAGPSDVRNADIVSKLSSQDRAPLETMSQWIAIANLIINQNTDVLTMTAGRWTPYLQPKEGAIIEAEMRMIPSVHTTARMIPGVNALIELVHDPKSTARHTMSPTIVKNFIELYQDWQDTTRLNRGVIQKGLGLFAMLHTPEIQNALQKDEQIQHAHEAQSEVQVQPLQDELAEYLAATIEASKAFCPTWTSLKAKLKPFANELLRQSRLTKHSLPIPEDANKRLTGVLRVLEQLGSTVANPAESYTKLKMLFIGEYREKQMIDTYVRALASGNAKPDVDVDTWHPATEDIALLDELRDRIEPIISKRWVPQTGTREDAITAMRKAIDQYYAARIDAKHEITRDEISAVVRSSGINENSRRRAAVLDHFIQLSDSQRHDASEPDVVHWPDTPPEGPRYFCVTLKNTANEEWAVFETLLGGNTFAIPLDIITMYGTLDEFLGMFDAGMQEEFAEYEIAHEDGWTAESHIARITAKIAE